jgi:crotonobetainyl-CoA:carnitine CoA-transferase CaiB-like acyl-CoA transferase
MQGPSFRHGFSSTRSPQHTTSWDTIENVLSPYRVLDLTDERGLACGCVLADLGADVVQVEPPDGSSARRCGPFLKGDPDPEHSLYWQAYARNKRGLVLDLEDAGGRAELLRLAEGADFLIESRGAREMERLGLGYEQLAARNPGLVYVSITPFGPDGPKADYAATDLVVQAASGSMALNGEADRAPLRVGGISAWTYGGIEAAGAALVAHHERERSGRGQHVNVSALLSTNLAAVFSLLSGFLGGERSKRGGGGLQLGPIHMPFIWEAADGFVSLTLMFAGPAAAFFNNFLEWMREEGALGSEDVERDWGATVGQVLTGQAEMSLVTDLFDSIAGFLRARTKAALLEAALERKLLLVPVSTVEDAFQSGQLAERGYWREVERGGTTTRHPGPFAVLSRTPIRYRRPAPRIGEHTREVLDEPARARAATRAVEPRELPLAGLKVLDFMWVMAGPHSTRVLADYGATVIKVEATSPMDLVRVLPPFYGGVPGPENSASFGSLNAGKQSLSLDLRKPESRAVVHDLVRWADVVTESFSTSAMKGLGLDYASLCEIKPDLIMLSSCLFGQTGPLSGMAGYGTMGAAVAGLVQPTGWPDRPPCGPFGPYTDWLAPRLTVPTLLAALDHRRRTGQGQYIDQAQAESALHFMAPALLDYAANGEMIDRVANSDPQMAPHGVYRADGDDEWVAIAVRDDDDWRRLCAAIGREDLGADDRLGSAEGRRAHADEIDAVLSEWAREQNASRSEQELQQAGVPAHAVVHAERAREEPQLEGHFVEAPHALHGTAWVESSRYRLSATPARVERAAPTIGQDTDTVLRELLGYDESRVESLRAAGALG